MLSSPTPHTHPPPIYGHITSIQCKDYVCYLSLSLLFYSLAGAGPIYPTRQEEKKLDPILFNKPHLGYDLLTGASKYITLLYYAFVLYICIIHPSSVSQCVFSDDNGMRFEIFVKNKHRNI